MRDAFVGFLLLIGCLPGCGPQCAEFPWDAEELYECVVERPPYGSRFGQVVPSSVTPLAWQSTSQVQRVLVAIEGSSAKHEELWTLMALSRSSSAHEFRWRRPYMSHTGHYGMRTMDHPPSSLQIREFCNGIPPVHDGHFFDPWTSIVFDCTAWQGLTGVPAPRSLPSSGWNTGESSAGYYY